MSLWFIKNLYEYLEVSENASQEEIQKAYHKKAHEHHPHKGGDEEEMKKLNVAYQVLSNPEKRKLYDDFSSDKEYLGDVQFDAKYKIEDYNEWIEKHKKAIKVVEEALGKLSDERFKDIREKLEGRIQTKEKTIKDIRKMIKEIQEPEKQKQAEEKEIQELTELIGILKDQKDLKKWKGYIQSYEENIRKIKEKGELREILRGIDPRAMEQYLKS